MSTTPMPASRLIELAAEDIATALDALPKNAAAGRLALLAWNVDDLVRRRLERAALMARAQCDLASARREMAVALEDLPHLADAAAQARTRPRSTDTTLVLLTLEHAFLCALLAQSALWIDRLLAIARDPLVKEEGLGDASGGVSDTIVRMLVATLDEDTQAFERARRRFAVKRKADRYFEKCFVYDETMALVLARDGAGLDDHLAQLDKRFAARATDRHLRQLPPLAASGADNPLVFDVWAVALANAARRRGLRPSFHSDVIPTRDWAEPVASTPR
jgi:hypothetical protein